MFETLLQPSSDPVNSFHFDKSDKILFICMGIIICCLIIMIITGCGIFDKCVRTRNSYPNENTHLLESTQNDFDEPDTNLRTMNLKAEVLTKHVPELKSSNCMCRTMTEVKTPKKETKVIYYENVNIQ